MYARTLRRIILAVTVVVAAAAILLGWQFVRSLRKARGFRAPDPTPIAVAGGTTVAARGQEWFAPIAALGRPVHVAPPVVAAPPIVYKGLWPDPVPEHVTAILAVRGEEVWVKVGEDVAGGVIREITEDAVVFEFGGRNLTIKREVRQF